MDFDQLPATVLKKIVRMYNLHTTIKGYSKMKKPALTEAMKKHLYIDDKWIIQQHGEPFSEDVETVADIPTPDLPNKKEFISKVKDFEAAADLADTYKQKADRVIKNQGWKDEADYSPLVSYAVNTWKMANDLEETTKATNAEENKLKKEKSKNAKDWDYVNEQYKILLKLGDSLIKRINKIREDLKNKK